MQMNYISKTFNWMGELAEYLHARDLLFKVFGMCSVCKLCGIAEEEPADVKIFNFFFIYYINVK